MITKYKNNLGSQLVKDQQECWNNCKADSKCHYAKLYIISKIDNSEDVYCETFELSTFDEQYIEFASNEFTNWEILICNDYAAAIYASLIPTNDPNICKDICLNKTNTFT